MLPNMHRQIEEAILLHGYKQQRHLVYSCRLELF
jgi:hypothetical protein